MGSDRGRRRELRQLLLNPELKTGLAWALKEQLRTLWGFPRAFLEAWRGRVEASGLAPLRRIANMIFSHLKGIFAWFWHPISNGPAEGFNSAILTLKHIARGFRNVANFRIAILFHHGKLAPTPRKSPKKQRFTRSAVQPTETTSTARMVSPRRAPTCSYL